MMLRITVFGWEIVAIECGRYTSYEEDEGLPAGGGSVHNFERDLEPLSPDDRYAPWDGFGFGYDRNSSAMRST
jgi:hypothetical protein